jgi:quinol monooxygenase YgiN
MVIVAGVLVLKPGTLDELRPDMLRMVAASRAEPGCISYSYGVDLVDASVVRVYEEWESRGHLDAHFQTEHLKAWRRRIAEVGIVSRDIKAWEAGSPVSI